MIMKKKVYTYITHQEQLLLFSHVDFPEAGIQVPGGTVEPGESILQAALREAQEETSLSYLHFVQKLGVVLRNLGEFGIDEIHERHFFHLTVDVYPGDTWISYELKPSDGSEGSIKFRFFWVNITEVPELKGGLDEMLPAIQTPFYK